MKRVVDIILSAITLALLSPLLATIAVLIKLDSKGPVFFRQQRLGKDCKVFTMLKFRTMIPNAESSGTGLFSYDDDPRVTRVGAWLRTTSFDELPQLVNVLKGDMSLVGPRPPVTYELGDIAKFSHETLSRFAIKPGMTGLAQIRGRNELSWPEKIAFDNEYLARYRRFGLLEDLRILALTPTLVVSRRNTIERRPGE